MSLQNPFSLTLLTTPCEPLTVVVRVGEVEENRVDHVSHEKLDTRFFLAVSPGWAIERQRGFCRGHCADIRCSREPRMSPDLCSPRSADPLFHEILAHSEVSEDLKGNPPLLPPGIALTDCQG